MSYLSQFKAFLGIISKGKISGIPVQVNIFLTNRCNIKCIQCSHSSKKPDQFNIEPDIKKFNKLIEELLYIGTFRFVISGHGEVFLNENFIEFIKKIKISGSICIANTNGTLLNRNIIDELIKIKFDELNITMSAGTKEGYIKTHPCKREDMFDNIKNNLLYLSERKSLLKIKKPKISLVNIIMSENHERLTDIAIFANTVKADSIKFNPVKEAKGTELEKLILTKEQSDYVKKEIIYTKKYLEKKKIKHNITQFLKAFNGQLNTEELYKRIPCYFTSLASYIDVDGNVYPCCRCNKPMGNIYATSFIEIWNSDIYKDFRKKALQLNKKREIPEGWDCHSCVNYNSNIRIFNMLNPLKRLTF